jgi:hypothetical protein
VNSFLLLAEQSKGHNRENFYGEKLPYKYGDING